MTPQEKAKDLINKFVDASIVEEEENYFHPRPYSLAKQCALIAVNEIIKTFRKDLPEIGLGKGFWYSVKQEIEKL